MQEKSCLVCNSKFIPNKYNPNQKYCKTKCAETGRKLNLSGTIKSHCKLCGEGIVRKNAKFCSKSCYTKFQLSRKNPNNKEVKIKCEVCEVEFWVKNYEKDKRKFCSVKCSQIGQTRPQNDKDTRIIKNCENCGNEYKVHKYRKNNSTFCSRECKHEFGRATIKCKFCKTEFESPRWRNKTFCSIDCSRKYFGQSNLEIEIENRLIEVVGKKHINIQETIYGTDFWYCVDFVIYDNIIIEVFGDYWHCNPSKFNESYYHKQLKKYAKEIREKDDIKIDNLKQMGYNVYVLWEDHDNDVKFNKNLNKIINEIQTYKTNKKG